MSGGKRNLEDVSDTMALVQAACKVLAITARPLAHFRHRRQPVRSAIGAAAKPLAAGQRLEAQGVRIQYLFFSCLFVRIRGPSGR